MTDRIYIRQYSRITAMRAIVVAVVLVLLFCVIFYPKTADAVCPDGYVSSVEDEELDWQMDALDIDYVKTFVQNILKDKEKYDFSALEKHPIVIAIIDTGINFEHEIFEGKYDESGAPVDTDEIGEYDVFLRDDDGNIISKNVVNTSKSATDDAKDYHGTHVAGIVATLIHKLDLEKYIKILPIKASYLSGKNSMFAVEDLQDAVDFALENGADIVNMSITDNGASSNASSKYDFVTKEMADKAIFLAASGNGAKNWLGTAIGQSSDKTVYYPAGGNYVVGVMNCKIVDGEYTLSEASNYGSRYDICLPGANIYSANGATNDGYKELSGTSMATPIASFACAVKMLQNRAMCQKNGLETKTPQEIASLLTSSYTKTIVKDGFDLKVFDFKELMSKSFSLQISADKNEICLSDKSDNIATFTAYLDVEIDLSSVVWTCKNSLGEIVCSAQGESFVFSPKDVDTYSVIATCEIDGEEVVATMQFCVKYLEYSRDEIEGLNPEITDDDSADVVENDGKIVVSSGASLTFAVGDFDYNYVSPTTDILWYVNGEFVASGDTFVCEFEKSGDYSVKAKINGIFTSEKKVCVNEVVNIDADTPNTLAICCGALIAVIMLSFVLSFVLTHIKRKV